MFRNFLSTIGISVNKYLLFQIFTCRQCSSVRRATLEIAASSVFVVARFHGPRLQAVGCVAMWRHCGGF